MFFAFVIALCLYVQYSIFIYYHGSSPMLFLYSGHICSVLITVVSAPNHSTEINIYTVLFLPCNWRCLKHIDWASDNLNANSSGVNQKVIWPKKTKFLDKGTLKTLVAALVQPHFDYACTTWYSSFPKFIKNKLQTAQNKMSRVILNHVGPSQLSELQWLSVDQDNSAEAGTGP